MGVSLAATTHLHPPPPDLPPLQLLADITSTWWLVSVVDNDYVAGDLFAVFAV